MLYAFIIGVRSNQLYIDKIKSTKRNSKPEGGKDKESPKSLSVKQIYKFVFNEDKFSFVALFPLKNWRIGMDHISMNYLYDL